MIPILELPTGIDDPTGDAAAATMRRTGARLNAPQTDVDLVLAVLFAPAFSFNPVAPSRVSEGTPLSPSDKDTIRALIRTGRDNAEIAAAVGCSVQAVVGVRVGMTKTREPA